MLTTADLLQISNAQDSTYIPAFKLETGEREVIRLQAVYAAKRTEMETFERLIAETVPDIVLRGHNGQKLVLRLPFAVGTVEGSIREALENNLLELESQIVKARLYVQEAAEKAVTYEGDEFRPLILALCQPAAPVAEQPSNSLVGQASQPQRDTLPTAA
jgi:hypothetical protein